MKVALAGAIIFLALMAALLGVFWYFRCPLSDRQIVKAQFDSELPGYSSVKILKSVGTGKNIADPKVLNLEVVMESYAGPVTCQGKIRYFQADPSFRELGWYDWTCINHWVLIEDARKALRLSAGPAPCQAHIETTALILKRWMEKGWVEADHIPTDAMRMQVMRLLDTDTAMAVPGRLFNISEAEVYDLVPELPEAEKAPTYVLRCDGMLELFLRDDSKQWDSSFNLQTGDILLPTPVVESASWP